MKAEELEEAKTANPKQYDYYIDVFAVARCLDKTCKVGNKKTIELCQVVHEWVQKQQRLMGIGDGKCGQG
jgi:hypothetical protein